MPLKTNCTSTWFCVAIKGGIQTVRGKNKKPRASECARFSRKLGKNISSSLAVFYVEQVALNRHGQSMSRKSVLLITQLISPWQFNNIYCRINGPAPVQSPGFFLPPSVSARWKPPTRLSRARCASRLSHLVNCGGGRAAREVTMLRNSAGCLCDSCAKSTEPNMVCKTNS